MENIYSIYKISNSINKKVYIGFTSNTVNSRWSMHKYQARSGKSKTKLHEEMRTLGCDKFFIEPIYQSYDREWTLKIEDSFIVEYNSIANGYNKRPGGQKTKIKQLTDQERQERTKKEAEKEKRRKARLEKKKLIDDKREQKKLQRAKRELESKRLKESRDQRRLEKSREKERLKKIRQERKEKIEPHVRLLCKTCNINPRAVNFHKNNKVYYRSQCDSCIKYTINEKKLGPIWYRAGYQKKAACEQCGFKPVMAGQLEVFQIDRNQQHVATTNLRTVCLNCNYELSRTGWTQGDLTEDL